MVRRHKLRAAIVLNATVVMARVSLFRPSTCGLGKAGLGHAEGKYSQKRWKGFWMRPGVAESRMSPKQESRALFVQSVDAIYSPAREKLLSPCIHMSGARWLHVVTRLDACLILGDETSASIPRIKSDGLRQPRASTSILEMPTYVSALAPLSMESCCVERNAFLLVKST